MWNLILMVVMFGLMIACLFAAYTLYTLGAGLAIAIPLLIAVACGIFVVHDFLRWKNNR